MADCVYCRKYFRRKFPGHIYCSSKCRVNRYSASPKGRSKALNWRKNNPDKIKKMLDKYTKSEKFKKQQHRYKTSEKGRRTCNRNWHSRRLKKLQLIEDFSNKEWLAKLATTKGFCPKCNIYVGIHKLTLDHIIPISRVPVGFVYTIDEVQPLCLRCNCKKGDDTNG